MKIALVPACVIPGNPEAGARVFAKWAAHYHAKADFILFPQMEAAPSHGKDAAPAWSPHFQAELLGGLAMRKNICMAAGFRETRGAETFESLALADRTGQISLRSRKQDTETEQEQPAFSLFTARILHVPAGLIFKDDLLEAPFGEAARRASLQMLVLPVRQTASRAEFAGADLLPIDLVEMLDRVGEIAKKIGAHALVVNALSAERSPDDAPCGGAWVCSPEGEIVANRNLYDETPVEFEIT